ncbi:MAG TPA: zinc-dependent metalloprotease [Fimbriiglobus sp.]|nr:zinc-dependent metalloprotease [Fimbriiglobus sp.]
MSRRLLTGLLFAAGLAVLIGPPIVGQEPGATPDPKGPPAVKGAKSATADDSDDPMKKYPEFAKVVKGAKVQEGLFTLHHKDDNVYAELRPDQFDKPFLVPIAVAKGAGMGGSTLNFGEEWVIAFKKVGDKVFVVRRNVRFTAKPGSPEAKAVDTTYSDSVLMAIPIKTVNPMKGTTVIDLNDIFFGDFANLGLGMLDRSRTTWHKVKAYKKNVELQVAATFSGSRYSGMFFSGGDDIIDPRGITVVVQYGLVELPDGGYQPRYADNRVGHFLTVQKDFSKATPDTSFVRMVNRWRLERTDGSTFKDGDRPVPPKKRIVYWIEDSVPDEYRTAVREGILEWNKAFEKVGFKNAIEVRQQDGQEFDPEDVTYATFRWITTDIPFAIGPSRANPLTGEILDADILFDGSFIQYYKQESRLFRDEKGRPVEPASMIRALHKGWDQPMHPLALRGSPFHWNDKPGEPPMSPEARQWQRTHAAQTGYCRCAAHKRSELALAVLHLAVVAGLKDDKVPDELIQQAVKETTMHEVGHTLGLRHNFKASTMLANDKLNDTELTRKIGQVGSVMDYNPANIAPKGVKQGDFFTTTIGPYDYWAIEYAYKPVSGGPDSERGALKKIASKAPTPELVYGTDEDLYGSPDPLINLYDLGADPMRFGMDRIKLAQDLFAKLPDKVVEKGEGYSRLRQAFTLLLGQYGDAAYLASRYVGGVKVNRDFKGDPNGRDPMVPVRPDKQREALGFVKENILTDKPFHFAPELLRKLAVEKWNHWGTRMSYGGVDFPVNERVLAIQEVVLDELLDGGTLSRIQNAARTAGKGEKPLTVAEVFRALTDGIFADLPGPDGRAQNGTKSSVVLRNLQRAYLARLGRMVVGPRSDPYLSYYIVSGGSRSVPADAKSLARLHLKEIGKRVDAALDGEKDDTVRAHLEETKERIAKVLAASVTANEP